MKDDKKKPIFEPITPEEAKKIKASGTYDSWDSGVLCTSGSTDRYEVCQEKYHGADCCYLDNAGNEIYGKCDWAGGFIYRGWSTYVQKI